MLLGKSEHPPLQTKNIPNIANICKDADVVPSKDTVNNIPSRDKPSIVIPEIAKNLGYTDQKIKENQEKRNETKIIRSLMKWVEEIKAENEEMKKKFSSLEADKR